jgi:hypothetical protein
MQRDEKERIPDWEEVAATAMAVLNMWLTSHSPNIGAVLPSLNMQVRFSNLKKTNDAWVFLYRKIGW